MPSNISVLNTDGVSKLGIALLDKIEKAIGGMLAPWQIRRVARAEADAEVIREETKIFVTALRQRAMGRFLAEETKKQENIESIANQAIPMLDKEARPEDMNDDWIFNFFDKCRLISDSEMQALWAKVLAGEANSPGKFSKRTINLLSSIDKHDAELFTNLCSYVWWMGDLVPLVFTYKDIMYMKYGIDFNSLNHLNCIGLISFSAISSFMRTIKSKAYSVTYYGNRITIEFPRSKENDLELGKVLLTESGQELAPICESKPNKEHFESVINRWRGLKYVLSSPYPRTNP